MTTPPCVHPAVSTLPTKRSRFPDVLGRSLVGLAAAIVVLATMAMLVYLVSAGVRAIGPIGFPALLTGARWRPEAGVFGGLPLIVGTLLTAFGALLLGAAPAIVAAAWLAELVPPAVTEVARRVMEIAAGIPSVVYGWLALIHLVPLLERLAHRIHGAEAPVGGDGIAAGALLLAAMIAPTVLLLALDAFGRVPRELRDAASALGASPLQTVVRVVAPGAWRGLLVASLLGFARATGEAMAVQMVIGGARRLPDNAFSPTTTIAAQIVVDSRNVLPGTLPSDALYAMALVLLAIAGLVVVVTRALSPRRVG